MKMTRKSIAKDGPGTVKLTPEVEEDLWHTYNLIAQDDQLSATTFRKVQKETGSGTESERVKLHLQIVVETVDYDSVAGVLRVRGKTCAENEHVQLGSYHALELEVQRPFTLAKLCWDSVALSTLEEACNPTASADLAAVVMQEGLAHVCLVGGSVTVVKARIETSIPRKRGPAIAGYDKAVTKFLEQVLEAVLKSVDFSVVRCLLVASPGFTKDQFYQHMMLEASRRDLRQIIENKSRIILVHSSSGYKHALKEVLSDPAVTAQIQDTKAAREVKALQSFFTTLESDPTRACYGPAEVELANERLAIETLLISDTLFRNVDMQTRRRYVDLVESVKGNGGMVHIFSSMHVSGEQLVSLTGIAARLRFPLPELEEMEV